MSREIKFRAWNGYDMIMPKDKSYYQHYMSFCGGITQKSSEGMECFGGGDRWRVVGDLKLMQFTGLKDANGVEIYEGDILCLDDLFVPVTFEDGCFQIITNKHQGASQLMQMRAKRFLVAGNIYQNPELLK